MHSTLRQDKKRHWGWRNSCREPRLYPGHKWLTHLFTGFISFVFSPNEMLEDYKSKNIPKYMKFINNLISRRKYFSKWTVRRIEKKLHLWFIPFGWIKSQLITSLKFERIHHPKIIIKHWSQHFITHRIDTEPWNGLQGKRFTFLMVR